MSLEGNLELLNLPEILKTISGQRKTGILTVQGDQDIIAVSFLSGHVVAADALNQTLEDGLGQVLAKQGLVTREVFAGLAAEHQAGQARLIDLLLERGLLERSQLLMALRLQTYQLLLQVMGWNRGEFKFYGGDEVSFEEGFDPISIEELFVRSSADLGKASGVQGELPGLASVYERRNAVPISAAEGGLGLEGTKGGARSAFDSTKTGVRPPTPASAIPLSPEEWGLLEQIDGRRSAGELADETGLGEYKVRYILHRLRQAGLAQPRGPATAPAPAPPAPAPSMAPPVPELFEQLVPAPRRRERAAAAEPAPRPASTRRPAAEPARRLAAMPRALAVWGTRLLAILAVATLVLAMVGARDEVLLPYPWLDYQRQVLEKQQRTALYLKLDRAARTYFLLEGHYPDDLRRLVTARLLSSRDLRDPQGRTLAFSAREVSYEVTPIAGGEPLQHLGTTESITGDFLLDPEFARAGEASAAPPVVLLD